MTYCSLASLHTKKKRETSTYWIRQFVGWDGNDDPANCRTRTSGAWERQNNFKTSFCVFNIYQLLRNNKIVHSPLLVLTRPDEMRNAEQTEQIINWLRASSDKFEIFKNELAKKDPIFWKFHLWTTRAQPTHHRINTQQITFDAVFWLTWLPLFILHNTRHHCSC